MRVALLCAATLSLTRSCAGQTLSVQGSFNPDLGGYYGSGFITDDSMYMVIDAEDSSARLMKFPITRDIANGNKIDSVDFANGVVITSEPYMELGWHDSGIGDIRWWNVFEEEGNLHWGTVDYSNNQYSEIGVLTKTAIESKNDAIGNYGIYGIDNHPSLTSANGKPYLYVTSGYLLGRLSLNDDNTVDSIETLGSLSARFPADLFFAPSGAFAGNVIVPSYSSGELWVINLDEQGRCLDEVTSLPITPVVGSISSSCKITVLIQGLAGAWGVFSDPVTNDLFIGHWGRDAVTPVYGFPPGCDFQVVIAQLESILLNLSILVNSGGRLLLDSLVHEPENLFKNDNSGKLSNSSSKANKSSKSSKAGGEKEIADPESIADETVTGILNGDLSGGDSATNQLAATFSNQSFLNSVDGDSNALITAQDNFQKVQAGLDDALARIKNNVPAGKLTEFEEKELEIEVQLGLLAIAVQLPPEV